MPIACDIHGDSPQLDSRGPNPGYLLMDKIYLVVYALIVLTLIPCSFSPRASAAHYLNSRNRVLTATRSFPTSASNRRMASSLLQVITGGIQSPRNATAPHQTTHLESGVVMHHTVLDIAWKDQQP
jgi:hypothetical protein